MPWHVGSDDRGGSLHYSCGVADEDEELMLVGGGGDAEVVKEEGREKEV